MSYIKQYSRTYEEWVRIKAKRIQSVLREFLLKKAPLSMSYLMQSVYFERLSSESFIMWKPIKDLDPETFTDFKPSAPMLNFIKHLIRSLVKEGYLEEVFCIVLEEIEIVENGEKKKKLVVKDSWFEYVVKKVPSLDYLIEFCTWKDPSL